MVVRGRLREEGAPYGQGFMAAIMTKASQSTHRSALHADGAAAGALAVHSKIALVHQYRWGLSRRVPDDTRSAKSVEAAAGVTVDHAAACKHSNRASPKVRASVPIRTRPNGLEAVG